MNNHTILFVDDETNILNSLKRLFRGGGYHILAATNGEEALEKLDNNQISLVISDQKMPGMSGVELLHQVRKRSPDTIRIILTGYADIKAAMEAINQGEVYRFVTKPWDPTEIRIIVSQALRQYDLIAENKKLYQLTDRQNRELKGLNNELERKVFLRTKEISLKNEELNRLYRNLEKGFFDSIRIFVDLIELYNPFFGGHSKRTALFSRLIAAKYELKEKELESIETAGMLHDIGMIGIPQRITDMPFGELEGEDKAIYEQHPVLGQITLGPIERFKEIGSFIRSHHERFDGKGFPDELKGESIPLAARIIAVADIYDKIKERGLSPRSSPSNQDALKYLKDESGTIFDPQVVTHFLSVLHNLKVNASRKEMAISLGELKKDMVLSRDIYTSNGRFLAVKGTILNEAYIQKIHNYHRINPINGKIYVYKW